MIQKLARTLWREESGQDLVEYGLLLVVISLAAVASMRSLAVAISVAYNNAASNLSPT